MSDMGSISIDIKNCRAGGDILVRNYAKPIEVNRLAHLYTVYICTPHTVHIS